jgi:Na+-transporting NADH:ubiquinone oxidoreductase subunit A
MALHKINKGLDLPISGEPEQKIHGAPKITRVALVADDYPGMKPRMAVAVGDTVVRGQLLFEDRKTEGVRHTAPGGGKVVGINRGAKRALQSVVIHLSDAEVSGSLTDADHQKFAAFTGKEPGKLSKQELEALLVESGLWTAFRTRPFSRVPVPGTSPQAIFVTAIDTNPLAPNPDVVLADQMEDFELGLELVTRLSEGKTYLCVREGSKIGTGKSKAVREEFAGPHPSGTVGLHIHLLHPVSRTRVVWHIGYQDVVAVARLAMTGKLDVSRVVSVAGPPVKKPRLCRARLGADVDDVLDGEFRRSQSLEGDTPSAKDTTRVVSGSVLSGKRAMGDAYGFLGRYHNQVSVLREGRERELLGWLAPGTNVFSTLPLFLSKLIPGKKFDFTTTTNGSARAMVPLGMYERVMPMDILPTFLLRSLMVGDVERAEQLGALELDEEDLALCTFVCPGKTNYGVILRKNLQTIQEEG